ncbi:MAG: zf-HC2 domain-containing protein [Candidatus Omnitrophota bacterium]
MDCKDCKKLLSKFLDHELDQKQQKIMTKHIEDCPACAQSLESITEMVNMMHKIKAINPPADFVENVNKRLDQLPFLDKVLNGIRALFFQKQPVRIYALMVSLLLVFALTSQLNLQPKKTAGTDGSMALKQQALSAYAPSVESQQQGFAAGKAKATQTKQESLMLSEPAITPIKELKNGIAGSDSRLEQAPADKTISNINGQENRYIKANKEQVLILSLDTQNNISRIKEILSLSDVEELKEEKQENSQIFLFKISYTDFLKLHSALAGIGQLEKATPNVELYPNPDNSLAWQEQAFKQLISVKLKVLK